jgi:hypothetical protein
MHRWVWGGLALAGAACGDSHSSVSGTVELEPHVEPSHYATLEIRAIEFDPDQPDARTEPVELSPFRESLPLEELQFPHDFTMIEGAFDEWSQGWVVAWLSQREGSEWVLTTEPFGAKRIDLVAPGPHLAPETSGVDVIIRLPD